MQFAGLILAAGRGSRFQHETGEPLPKVLRPVMGEPMVFRVIDTLNRAGVDEITLVVGYGAEEVKRVVGKRAGYVLQEEQKGSGHAAKCAVANYKEFDGGLVIMCGDSPLFTANTIGRLMQAHEREGASVTLVSAVLGDPHGYGRILRDSDGRIEGVVEEKCATAEQREIREVNGGAYAFDARWLFDNIGLMELNEANEYNLTDMVRVAVEQQRDIATVECDPRELLGVNTPAQLEVVEEILRNRGMSLRLATKGTKMVPIFEGAENSMEKKQVTLEDGRYLIYFSFRNKNKEKREKEQAAKCNGGCCCGGKK